MGIFDAAFDPDKDAAFVTGAGNGIGRAIAQALVGEGVRTVFADIAEERVLAAIASSPQPNLGISWAGDLAIRTDRESLLAFSRTTLGRPPRIGIEPD